MTTPLAINGPRLWETIMASARIGPGRIETGLRRLALTDAGGARTTEGGPVRRGRRLRAERPRRQPHARERRRSRPEVTAPGVHRAALAPALASARAKRRLRSTMYSAPLAGTGVE